MTAAPTAGDHNLPVTTVEGLAEIDHGFWEGLTEAQIQQRFGISFYTWLRRPSQTLMPGGEHTLAVQLRVLGAWRSIVAHNAGHHHVLVVSHDIPLKVIIADVLQLSLDHIGQFVLNNAAITTIQHADGDLQVLQINDRCHLDI